MPSKLAAQRAKTGLDEAVRTGMGRIAGLRVAVGIMESQFFMGSMGSVVGEKLATPGGACHRRAPAGRGVHRVGRRAHAGGPGVAHADGEGVLRALRATPRRACRTSRCITDPTTGGVTASFAMHGDIDPGRAQARSSALPGSASSSDTIKQELPEGFQTAEFALEHGLIDAIVERGELRATLAHLLALHAPSRPRGAHEPGDRDILVTYEAVCENLASGAGTYNAVTYGMLPVRDSLAR